MNIASAKMLNDSLEELANTFRANRAMEQVGRLQEERDAIDRAYREAQFQYLQDRAFKQDEQNQIANKRADLADKDFGLKQAASDFADAQNALQSSMASLAGAVKTGAVSPDDATAAFRSAIDDGIGAKSPALHQQLMNVPQFNVIYNGKADWDKLSEAMERQQAARQPMGAVEKQVEDWNTAQLRANDSGDPQDQARADALYDNLPVNVKATAAPRPPRGGLPAQTPAPVTPPGSQQADTPLSANGTPQVPSTPFRQGSSPAATLAQPATQAKAPTASAMAWLLQNPDTNSVASFERFYGPGSAAPVLKLLQSGQPGQGTIPAQ